MPSTKFASNCMVGLFTVLARDLPGGNVVLFYGLVKSYMSDRLIYYKTLVINKTVRHVTFN